MVDDEKNDKSGPKLVRKADLQLVRKSIAKRRQELTRKNWLRQADREDLRSSQPRYGGT